MGEAARKAVSDVPVAPPQGRQALLINQLHAGEWELIEATIVGNTVTSEKRVGHAYFRDLIEQAASRHVRKLGRK